MLRLLRLWTTLLVLSLTMGFATAASAGQVLRFTATSAASGLLGSIDYDSSVFDGSSFQFVANSNILAINFEDPLSAFFVNTPGPSGNSTIFNSTGALPTVVGGSGLTGGSNTGTGLYIAGTSYVAFLSNGTIPISAFSDVSWSTVQVASVPESATWAMMIAGFGMVGFAMRARRRQSVKTTVLFA